jgi:hypothetical protein
MTPPGRKENLHPNLLIRRRPQVTRRPPRLLIRRPPRRLMREAHLINHKHEHSILEDQSAMGTSDTDTDDSKLVTTSTVYVSPDGGTTDEAFPKAKRRITPGKILRRNR